MATIYAVVSPHSQIQIKTERLSPAVSAAGSATTPGRPLRPLNSSEGEPSKARRQLAMNLNKGGPVINNRRNARERNRVKQVNQGFAVLRAHLPAAPKSKKVSKVDTLRGAIDYIHALSDLLAASDEYDSPARYDSAAGYDSPYDSSVAGYDSPGFVCAPAAPPTEPSPGSVYQPAEYGVFSPAAAALYSGRAELEPPRTEPPSYREAVRPLLTATAVSGETPSPLHWWHLAGAQHTSEHR